jgi:hypothetical protein
MIIDGREYYESRGIIWPLGLGCEHCDCERSSLVRVDCTRGQICPDCDSSLDEMFEETA